MTRVKFAGIPEGVSPYVMLPWFLYLFGVEKTQGNTRAIVQLVLQSVHKVSKVVVTSPILGMSVEGWTWICWSNGRDARDMEMFCRHMAVLALPLYLNMGVKVVLTWESQGLLEAIWNMPEGYEDKPEPGVISFDDNGTVWR